MNAMISRRTLLKSSGAAIAANAIAAKMFGADAERYRIGYTTNTVGGWEKDMFQSFRDAHQVGYHYVETFVHYFVELGLYDKPKEVTKRMDDIGVQFVTISNGAPMETRFED